MTTKTLKNPETQLLSELLSLKMEDLSVAGFERVIKVTDAKSGLTAIIALHDTRLGPALGGTRIYPYASFDEALTDACRLAEGMTYKSAVAEVGCGGGKSVIIADPKKDKTPALLQAFGAAVNRLAGDYIAAEDAGSTTADIAQIRKSTQYVVGLAHAKSSGDPSPFTAWGVLRGVQSVVKQLYKTDSLEGKKVAIQGLGNVGSRLAELLFWQGAELILSDIDPIKTQALAAKYNAKAVSPDEILSVECDVLSPCAMGAILNDKTLPKLRCRAIAGAANNQLHSDVHADRLKTMGILYAPDFVINAGGLLNVAAEIDDDGYSPTGPRYKTNRIYDTLLAIYEIADRNQESTHKAALSLAEYRLKHLIGKRTSPPVFHHNAE